MNCPPIGKRLDGMIDLSNEGSSAPEFNGFLQEKYITIAAASKLTGYNKQYLRRLLRNGKLDGVRVGQAWLIRFDGLSDYQAHISGIADKRWGARGTQSSLP